MRTSRTGSVLKPAGFLLVPLLAAGCFQGQRVIRVNANGSGTITDTVTLGDEARSMMEGLKQNLGPEAGKQSDPLAERTATEAKLRERAAAMGPGVTLVSFQPAVGQGPEKVTYAFADINKIRIAPTPDFPENDSKDAAKEPLTFRLEKRGAVWVLTVTGAGPKPKEKKDTAAPSAEAAPAAAGMQAGALAMMKAVMKGLKMTTQVQVDGTLVSTTSPWVQGSKVTLLDVDFDQLMADEASFKKLSEVGDPSQLDPALLKDVKGIKVQTTPVTTIEFR
ncbi:MAG TPA: hypothetical protein VMX54_00655 [Vicinamibacteria bacterium]|nr:hypothetical protein [Vicinamibacteria bacterium]